MCNRHSCFQYYYKRLNLLLSAAVLVSYIYSDSSPSLLFSVNAFPSSNTNHHIFCTTKHHQQQQQLHTKLYVFGRPDWMRRMGRIEKKKEENKMYVSLSERRRLLGVGKKFKCFSPPSVLSSELSTGEGDDLFFSFKPQLEEGEEGLLNVYLDIPENDIERCDKTNIINQLESGEIVTSVGPRKGVWIEHDKGGWSPTVLDGFTRLRPVSE